MYSAFKDYARPLLWKKNIWDLDPENDENNGFQNEDLIVWMRTAALPTFRKLYRRIDHSQEAYKDGLPKGNYTLKVEYSKYLLLLFFLINFILCICNAPCKCLFFRLSSNIF